MKASPKVLPGVAEPQEEAEEEEEEAQEDTDFDCQAMWRNVALAPVWAGGDADSLRGPLAAALEPLELTKRRVQSVLAIACRHAAWDPLCKEASREHTVTKPACERALGIIRELQAAGAAGGGGGGGGGGGALNADLATVLDELRLDYPVKRGGPLSLPYPSSMAEDVVFYAQRNWEYFRASTVNWTDAATLEWVRFALVHSDKDKTMKHAALCLLGRVQTGLSGLPIQGRSPYNYELHEGTPSSNPGQRQSMRSPDDVFADICEPALLCSRQLMDDELNAYTERHGLRDQSSVGGIVAPPEPHALTTEELDMCGGKKLSQAAFLPFMHTKHRTVVESAKIGWIQQQFWEMGLRGMTIILAHFLQDNYFDPETSSVIGDGEGGCAQHRLAPNKTLARIYAKADSDHKDAPAPVTAQNLDVCRKSICSPDARSQLSVYRQVCEKFRVLRVKNTFRNDPEETLGMMQILVNILLAPSVSLNPSDSTSTTVRPLTYGDMLDAEGGALFERAVESAMDANGGMQYRSYIRQAASLFDAISGLREEPIRMVCELQLHLSWFLEQRKKTHLWFKILRAETIKHLNLDCSKFRNGPLNEHGLCGGEEREKGEGEGKDGGDGDEDEDDDDDDEEEDGGLLVRASCDECDVDLFLVAEIRSHACYCGQYSAGQELDAFVLDREAVLQKDPCEICETGLKAESPVYGCQVCDFTVCGGCWESKWWHRAGGVDMCKVHFEGLPETERGLFVCIEKREDMLDEEEREEYFD
jgi:hypothetical protein